ncbi:hypothetical protein KKC1_27450 [Calderihabitans maritimus]|uniref:Uncharacterized protein n=1 Tax=Calderihabitans maritimus TaxID=1246530 RepID=A0A1Z5HW91_9FIRM|nr:hypothetical protein KKC1_27450 [Calderihabitans maritimus]
MFSPSLFYTGKGIYYFYGSDRPVSEELTVRLMSTLRLLIGILSLVAAFLMIKYHTVGAALRINAFVGLVNPLIFISINILGIANMAGKVSLVKLIAIMAGVVLIFYGTGK